MASGYGKCFDNRFTSASHDFGLFQWLIGTTHTHTHQVEVLGGMVDELNAHSKALKTNQELTFTEPMKK